MDSRRGEADGSQTKERTHNELYPPEPPCLNSRSSTLIRMAARTEEGWRFKENYTAQDRISGLVIRVIMHIVGSLSLLEFHMRRTEEELLLRGWRRRRGSLLMSRKRIKLLLLRHHLRLHVRLNGRFTFWFIFPSSVELNIISTNRIMRERRAILLDKTPGNVLLQFELGTCFNKFDSCYWTPCKLMSD